MFRGYIDTFDLSPNRNDRDVQITCRDQLARLSDLTISTTLLQGIRTGDAVNAILDAIGWTGGRDIDTGGTVIPLWWAEAEDALAALQKVVASEGSPALAYIDPQTGSFVFRDRHHRLIRSASTTSQATFRDKTTEPLFSEPVTYDAGFRDIINDVVIEVEERVAHTGLASIFSSDETFTLGAGASTSIEVQASDPFLGALVPVQDTDYVVRVGSVASITLSRTSGQSTTVTITAGGSGVVIGGMNVRAYGLPVVRTVKITSRDATSIADYGSRNLPDDLTPVWASRYDAQALADLYVLQRKNRLPILSITVRGAANSARLTQCLARDLSDRITVIDAVTGLSSDFFIERIEHAVDASQGGRILTTTFGLERAPAAPTAAFILDSSTLGSGALAY